jgi:hypothetical protein
VACFAVVDVDDWDSSRNPSSQLNKAIHLAKDNEIQLLISNLKFEVWLVWHLEGTTPKLTSTELDKQCLHKKILNGKNLHPDFPLENYKNACIIASRQQKVTPNTKGSNPSSAIPRLFEFLEEL